MMHIEEQGLLIRHLVHGVKRLLSQHRFKKPILLTIYCDVEKALVINGWNHDNNLESMLSVKIIFGGEKAKPQVNSVCTTVDGCELFLSPVDINPQEMLKEYRKELENCYKFLHIKQLKLSNTKFRQKAKPEIVQKEEAACVELEKQIQTIKSQISEMENYE